MCIRDSISSENVFVPPLESTSIDILREAEEEYDTEISLLLDQIMGNEKSVNITKGKHEKINWKYQREMWTVQSLSRI